MKFLDKLSKYNQRISFNIFALNGYFALLMLLKPLLINGLVWLWLNAIVVSIYLITFIVYCVEVVTQYELPITFLKDKHCSFILLFGALVSIIYLLLLILFFVLPLFMQF